MTDHATAAPRSSPGQPDARGEPGAAGRGPAPAAGGLSGTRYVLGVVLLVCLAWVPVLIMIAAGRMSLHP